MKTVQQMVAQLEGLLGTKDISEWEDGFIRSVAVMVQVNAERKSPLSDKQIEVVERIHRKHFA